MNIGKLAERYTQLASTRDTILDRARECAKVTIPFLYPFEGTTQTQRFETPWQSFGARAVNNLSSRLLITQFPPNTPFFRYVLDEMTRQKLGASVGDVDKALSKVERTAMQAVETNAMRPALAEVLKQLIVAGNTLCYMTPQLKLRVFNLRQYVNKRDPEGSLLEVIVKECISPLELPEAIRQAVLDNKRKAATGSNSAEDTVDIYTGVQRVQGGYRVWQECEGILLPDSLHHHKPEELRWLSLRWTAIDGEDYGRGYVEQYLGDFKSLEALSQAIVEGSAAAARVLFLVKPNSTTKKETLAKAPSGSVNSGNAEDVTVVQMEKFSDFRIAGETKNELMQGLAYAFLLNSALQRDAERVTAEEIRMMAQELETALGGVYATLAHELQLPLASLIIATLSSQGKLPKLPKDVAKPAITTGVEALGRGNDAARLRAFFASFQGLPDPILQAIFARLNVEELIKRTAASVQIDPDGLIKSEEEMQQDQAKALAQQAALAAAPNVAKGMVEQSAAQGA